MPLYAGLDIGGTHLKFGLIDEAGKLVFYSLTQTPKKLEEWLQNYKIHLAGSKKTGRKPNHIDRDRLGNKAGFIGAALWAKKKMEESQAT